MPKSPRLLLAVAVAVLIGGITTPLPASAAEDIPLSVFFEAEVLDARETLIKAETEAAAILTKARAEADADLADAQAKADATITEAMDELNEAIADARRRAAGDPAVLDARDKLEQAETEAAAILTKAQANLDKAIVEAELAAAKLAEELADICSSAYGYGAERSIGSMYNIAWFTRANEAWAAGYTGAGIDVAVIDTGTVPVQGLDDGKVIYGPDFSLEADHAEVRQLDTYGHGTHIAGIIAGNDYDTSVEGHTPGEFQGIAPDARIVSVKVADSYGTVDPSQVIAAIDWVISHRNDNGMNIRVINLSYTAAGTQPYTIDPLAKAVENAWDAGIVVVAAAGNDGDKSTKLGNPGYDPYVISVSAILEKAQQNDGCLSDKLQWETTDYASHANHNERQPDIYAPGSTVVSLRNPGSFVDQAFPAGILGDRYTKATGTSQSAAVVSGAAAVLLDARPELTPDEVKAVLIASANDDNVPTLNIATALEQPVPADATQTWPRSTGLGSLEATRGGEHILLDGEPLTGENTVFGPWTSDAWLESSLTGSSWTGSSWTGSSWTGSSWG